MIKYGLEDVGSRVQHLMELQDMWSAGYALLTNGAYHTQREKDQAKELEAALKLLETHITNIGVDVLAASAKEINDLPQPGETNGNNTQK
jgi:hypothetical protein